MRPWKTILGLGAACALCCAAPSLGLAGLSVGTSALAATGTALLARTGGFVALGAGLLAAASALLWVRHRRRATRLAQQPCGCEGACGAGRG